jgi:hypothetical protein
MTVFICTNICELVHGIGRLIVSRLFPEFSCETVTGSSYAL